jgi:hypothetical protein
MPDVIPAFRGLDMEFGGLQFEVMHFPAVITF